LTDLPHSLSDVLQQASLLTRSESKFHLCAVESYQHNKSAVGALACFSVKAGTH
jgi:hypothetical protein